MRKRPVRVNCKRFAYEFIPSAYCAAEYQHASSTSNSAVSLIRHNRRIQLDFFSLASSAYSLYV
jgi:hypothetical protein